MSFRFVAALGLILSLTIGTAHAGSTYAIAINTSIGDGDGIAQRIINAFQSDIVASSQYSMVSDERNANYIIEFASIVDDSNSDNTQQTSAYSVVLLDHNWGYVSSLVGVCGDEKASSCAEHLLESVGSDISHDQSSSSK
ncbi:MAG TPA: hypothetical protein PK231_07335 [Acidocella sp.]|jgi:hypothetical protein|nr:MAG: hypothetical protein B7Z77_02600 [Acidocella sp. 20-58-15]OYY03446.1 MAG: hypothetical protein B7Y73_06770 [Acidocella sp. 35-58-6]HQT39222.1 hypothetical protein [Acidocella sp.]